MENLIRERQRLGEEPIYCAAYDDGEEVLYHGSDSNLTHPDRIAQRLRYEEQALRYLRGQRPRLICAALRGPFDEASGWRNPWLAARRVDQQQRLPKSTTAPTKPAVKALPGITDALTNDTPGVHDSMQCHLPSPDSHRELELADNAQLDTSARSRIRDWASNIQTDTLKRDDFWAPDISADDASDGNGTAKRSATKDWLKSKFNKRRKTDNLSFDTASTPTPAVTGGLPALTASLISESRTNIRTNANQSFEQTTPASSAKQGPEESSPEASAPITASQKPSASKTGRVKKVAVKAHALRRSNRRQSKQASRNLDDSVDQPPSQPAESHNISRTTQSQAAEKVAAEPEAPLSEKAIEQSDSKNDNCTEVVRPQPREHGDISFESHADQSFQYKARSTKLAPIKIAQDRQITQQSQITQTGTPDSEEPHERTREHYEVADHDEMDITEDTMDGESTTHMPIDDTLQDDSQVAEDNHQTTVTEMETEAQHSECPLAESTLCEDTTAHKNVVSETDQRDCDELEGAVQDVLDYQPGQSEGVVQDALDDQSGQPEGVVEEALDDQPGQPEGVVQDALDDQTNPGEAMASLEAKNQPALLHVTTTEVTLDKSPTLIGNGMDLDICRPVSPVDLSEYPDVLKCSLPTKGQDESNKQEQAAAEQTEAETETKQVETSEPEPSTVESASNVQAQGFELPDAALLADYYAQTSISTTAVPPGDAPVGQSEGEGGDIMSLHEPRQEDQDEDAVSTTASDDGSDDGSDDDSEIMVPISQAEWTGQDSVDMPMIAAQDPPPETTLSSASTIDTSLGGEIDQPDREPTIMQSPWAHGDHGNTTVKAEPLDEEPWLPTSRPVSIASSPVEVAPQFPIPPSQQEPWTSLDQGQLQLAALRTAELLQEVMPREPSRLSLENMSEQQSPVKSRSRLRVSFGQLSDEEIDDAVESASHSVGGKRASPPPQFARGVDDEDMGERFQKHFDTVSQRTPMAMNKLQPRAIVRLLPSESQRFPMSPGIGLMAQAFREADEGQGPECSPDLEIAVDESCRISDTEDRNREQSPWRVESQGQGVDDVAAVLQNLDDFLNPRWEVDVDMNKGTVADGEENQGADRRSGFLPSHVWDAL
ncbi:hypothetical protein KJ359_000807 [Pestalotiopsis sp. 9143b]|nr:hypothetical protein KJ359_000807 [Pestalotiopsis sp. 9143b]